MSGKFRVGDKEIRYKVKRGNSSKYLSLKLKPNLELEIILPRGLKLDVEEILNKRRAWIEETYNELLNARKIFDNDRILYIGGLYDIRIIHRAKNGSKVESDEKTKTITIYADRKDSSSALRRWMKEKTKNYVRKEVDRYTKTLGIEFNKIYIRDMRKWGSCSRKRNLSFNWQLIALPEKLAEYVIIHEAVHLMEFNHSKSFHEKIISLCPDYKEREKTLKNYLLTPLPQPLIKENFLV